MTSYSSFIYIATVVCTTVNRNLTVRNMLITHGILNKASNVCREIDGVRGKRLRRRQEHDRLRRERTNEELRFVNLWPHLSLLRRRANDRNRHVEQCEELMEGVSPLILLYSVVAIALQYSYNTY